MKCGPKRAAGLPPIHAAGTGADISEHTSGADPHPQYQLEGERGLASGYASLDPAGLVPSSELPQASQTTAGIASFTEIHGSAAPDLFGTGAEGNLSVTTGTYTMTRDIDCENLTVASGATLATAGFRVRVLNTLTWSGTISCNGTDASGSEPGIGGGGGGTASSYATGTDGAAGLSEGAGGSSAASNGNWGALHSTASACRGGSGGSSGTQAGGTAGTTTAPPISAGFEHSSTWETGYLHGNTVVRLRPGSGGGSGGATLGGTSGGGGGGGGVCAVFARRISGSGGAHTANGGNGGEGTLDAGGGGGGGGGIVLCRYVELIPGASLPAVSVAGGSGGPGAGGGANGSPGSAGFSSVRSLVRS